MNAYGYSGTRAGNVAAVGKTCGTCGTGVAQRARGRGSPRAGQSADDGNALAAPSLRANVRGVGCVGEESERSPRPKRRRTAPDFSPRAAAESAQHFDVDSAKGPGQNVRPRSRVGCRVSFVLALLLVLVGLSPEKSRFSSGWFFDEDVWLLPRESVCTTV